ncbi:hypothetical protein [Sorangium sp. So ce1000]|uniref:hypothetical protein n=1 Tax=Sorangium sp. So ce1000 TaxID=3133325 RepID=UPI003F6373C5
MSRRPTGRVRSTATGERRLELSLAAKGEITELTFVQRLADPALAGGIGPGWEYYLDVLVASRLGEPLPSFADDYPARRAHDLGDARTPC